MAPKLNGAVLSALRFAGMLRRNYGCAGFMVPAFFPLCTLSDRDISGSPRRRFCAAPLRFFAQRYFGLATPITERLQLQAIRSACLAVQTAQLAFKGSECCAANGGLQPKYDCTASSVPSPGWNSWALVGG